MRELLCSHKFKELFIQLGWDNFDKTQTIDGHQFKAIAAKGGLPIFVCRVPDLNELSRKTALDLDNQLAKFAAEHIIVWHDETAQLWQFSKREIGKANKFNRFGPYHNSHSFEDLSGRLKHLGVSLDEEIAAGERGGFGIIEIAARINRNFDVDKVSGDFYKGFSKQRDALLTFLTGLDGRVKDEYASLMLTRLMFLYFMQAKGFLLGDTAYLRNHFENPDARLNDGDDFYHGFLCPLFFEVLSKKRDDRFAGKSDDDKRGFAVFGDLIYLNGGLFARRDFESNKIGIDDAFFKDLFDFFDKWNWVLDDRPTRNGNEINPDVLGYVFEKFINQKQMGAYYTKEDITGYIARNSILPFLFEKAAPDAKRALDLVRNNPARYVYPAVKHGCERVLPAYIQQGIGDVAARGRWNESATSDLGLPTEIWREVVARRARYFGLTANEFAVQFDSVADLITHNLDIELWMTDVIANLETQDEVWNLWQALENVTILDPTVGSGAFLFAAMNILEPLYRELLARMDEVVEDFDERSQKHPHLLKGRVEDFRLKVREMDAEVNRGYQTFKKMMVSNLYGVDIMGEAVEICKLRLFLKLAAQATPQAGKDNLGIQPLPDIDFNIRAGNTLVGFATLAEAQKAAIEQLALGINWNDVKDEARDYGADLERFRETQKQQGQIKLEDKRALEAKHDHLIESFDQFLGGVYGQMVKSDPKGYEHWRQTHQPFHWCAEFYNVMQNGGFDVIIGNPPYVAASKARTAYNIRNYQTERASDIYAWVLERVKNVGNSNCWAGMIVPLSLSFSGDFDSCRKMLVADYGRNWFSSFARIPAALFDADVRVRNVIWVGSKTGDDASYTTRLYRWFEDFRPHLMESLSYSPYNPNAWKYRIPKTNTPALTQAFERLNVTSLTLEASLSAKEKRFPLHFKKSAYNWLCFCRDLPPCYDGNDQPIAHTKFGTVYFPDEKTRNAAFLFLNGKIQFAYWAILGDDFDVTKWMFADFPFYLARLPKHLESQLECLTDTLSFTMQRNVSFKLNAGKKVGNYNLAKCRSVTDKSDAIFAEHLGLCEVWPDIEMLYNHIVKTNFSETEGNQN